jgi:ketosteroid isomerase-like protein
MLKLQVNTEEIEIASNKFYDALQAMFTGDTTLMEKVWSHADDVSYLGPQGGIITGWKNVFNAWKEQAKLKLKGKIEIGDMHIIQEGNIAIVQQYEIGSNLIHGNQQKVNIRATNIFRKENGNWKMISHQTDPLSFLQGSHK